MPEHCHITATSLPIGSKNHCPITADAASRRSDRHCSTAPPARHGEMPRHASRRRARCRARLAVKCRLAHADAACACPGRHENARARGKAAGLFLTASRSRVTAPGQKLFPILPNVPSRAPAPARHKATDFTATCAAERARSWRPSSIACHPSPCVAERRHQRVHSHLVRVSPDKKQTSQHCRNPLIPPGSALPSLPVTAIGQHCHSRRQHCG